MAVSLWGKISGSLRERGVVGTGRHAMTVGARAAQGYLDGRFDRRFGTDTVGTVELAKLEIKSKNVKNGIYYEAIPERVLRDIIDGLAVDYYDYTFIDFGSGKGRALLIASEYPFRKIIGVEFAPALHEVAISNFARYSSRTQKCRDIQSICEDATTYELPSENIVAFLYTPFKPPVLKVVMERILNSVKAHPRKLVIAFYGNEPNSVQILTDTGLHMLRLKIRHDYTHPIQRFAITLKNFV